MGKQKKSFLRRFFKFIFILVLIVVLAVAGLGVYAYFKYHINSFALIGQIGELKKSVSLEEVIDYQYTDDDLNMANLKVNELSTKSVVKFTDAEVTAYVDNHIQDYQIQYKSGENSKGLSDYDFDLCEIKFVPSEHGLVDIQIVGNFNIVSLKKEKLSSFPASMFKGMYPDSLYVTGVFTLTINDNKYEVNSSSLMLNNLNADKSQNLLNVFAALIKIDADEFIQNVCKAYADIILSDNGLYGDLQGKGVKDWTFEKTETGVFFDVYTADTTETRTITYNNTKGATNLNPETFTIKDNIITLQPIETVGYTFGGWFIDEEQITQIDASVFTNYSITARWTVITYNITIDKRGGYTTSTLPTKYNITSADIVLPTNLYKSIPGESDPLQFKGYIGTDVPVCTKNVTIPTGSVGDRTYYAYYEGEEANVTLCIESKNVDTIEINKGLALDMSTMFNPAEFGMGGYYVKKWYTDIDKTVQFDLSEAITQDMTLYGDWSYISDNISFYPYLSDFDSAQTSGHINIASRDMLVAYMDYITFFNKTNSNVELALTYVGQSSSEIQNEVSTAYNTVFKNQPHFSAGSSTGYTIINTNTYVKFYIKEDDMVLAPTQEFTDTAKIKTDQDYALRLQVAPTRAENFDDFNINKVSKTLNVKTSEQLVWALENGYRPTFSEENTPAEKVYNSAKAVLRQIINDDMDDVTKLRAIYEWLNFNVNYDHQAAESEISSWKQAREYYAWSAEGVFEKGRVVCEGYAKALLIMAQIENIPTVIVTGNNHAWNKVFVNGAWYGIDATHGDAESSYGEILTYTSFLFTDEYKASKGYTAVDYTEFVANTEYDYFDTVSFAFNDTTFDLEIDNVLELTNVFKYVKNYIVNTSATSSYFIFEIYLTSENTTHLNSWISLAETGSGLYVLNAYIPNSDSEGNTAYTLLVNAG
ncbi:MAG: InlB B-repeat-containing protein [Clostridia bacterium]|nr:InlB B-repeat-containing protein [Clostridia bacterium]